MNKVLVLAFVLVIAALPGYCAQTISIKQTAIKFLLAMGGVVLSSIVIYAGLTFYNHFFVDKRPSSFGKEDSLSTPDNIEDAVAFFIKKNKLK